MSADEWDFADIQILEQKRRLIREQANELTTLRSQLATLTEERDRLQASLKRIAQIIEQVDTRCMACDGPVTPTLKEMTQAEISEIYKLAAGRDGT